MLLTGAGSTRALVAVGADPKPGDAIAVHFSVPSPQGPKHFRTQARIARLLDNGQGVGVLFDDGLPEQAFNALLAYAGASGLVPREAAPEPATGQAVSTASAPAAAPASAPAGTSSAATASAARADGSLQPESAVAQVADGGAALGAAASEVGIPLDLLQDSRLSDAAVGQARALIQDVARVALEGIGKHFIDTATRELLASARDAGSNTEHTMYLEALDFFEKQDRRIIADLAASVTAQLATVTALDDVLEKRRRRETGGGRDLQLVDAQGFEDWLAIADIISKAEARFDEVLFDLRAQLGLMARPWAHKDAVPVGPSVIAWAFADLLRDATLPRQVCQDTYRYFEWTLLLTLGPFYEQLSVVIDESGLFPSSSRLRELRAQAQIQAQIQAQNQNQALDQSRARQAALMRRSNVYRPDPQAYQHMESVVREAAMAADGFAGAQGRDFDPFLRDTNRGGRANRAARNLLEAGRRSVTGTGAAPLETLMALGAGADRAYSRADILEALTIIEREQGDGSQGDGSQGDGSQGDGSQGDGSQGAGSQGDGSQGAGSQGDGSQGAGSQGDGTPSARRLKPRLLEILKTRHGNGKRLRPQDLDDLSVLETLVDSIESDRYLTQGVRAWIRRLELTLNKLAAADETFLDGDAEQPHSAVMMLNQLARLGVGTDTRDGIDGDVGRRVEALLERVIREFDGNPKVFSEAVDELDPLLDKQARLYRGNLERTVRASEGKQKLARARRAVLTELHGRLAGRDVPHLLLELINPGWRNLLVHTHLRRGTDSSQWRDQLGVLDQLQGQLTGEIAEDDPLRINPETLLKQVVQGLNSISFDPAKRTPLVMALSGALIGDAAGERDPVRHRPVAPADVADLTGLDGPQPDFDPQIEAEDDAVRRNWDTAVARARRIEVGEWLATADADGRPLILAVAFLGDDAGSFVLVNRKGVKIRECSFREMAESLHSGRMTLLDDFDLPLMERASQRMLESMHSRLAFQAAHDELTMLLNRREFERLVGKAVQSAKAVLEQHALLYIDLDQFKIINNTSGHTAGDEMLKYTAGLLAGLLDGERQHLARLGGDEFGILVERCQPTAARAFAARVLERIRGGGFEWEGRTYNLSASMGLVLIDQATESVDLAMQYADEACYAAKDAGRNRIQEYQFADTAIRSRHGIMEWVTHLDKALAEDRLILNCQRVAPTNPARGGEAHYEILLTMADESGAIMPPAEFILAAETYQRMAAIDRWVIERVLRWMAEHRDRLDHFGGFAINVSGHSMNEESFPDFVLDQFARTQAPTSKVCFEITETAAIASLDNAREFMSRMKIIGCRFALDDFGTGLSSYSYLRNLPVDYVKIDGVFVRDVANDMDDYAVVRSINEIGHYLGKQTIAECVESKAVLDALEQIGVDFVQGFFIDKPTPLDALKLYPGS